MNNGTDLTFDQQQTQQNFDYDVECARKMRDRRLAALDVLDDGSILTDMGASELRRSIVERYDAAFDSAGRCLARAMARVTNP